MSRHTRSIQGCRWEVESKRVCTLFTRCSGTAWHSLEESKSKNDRTPIGYKHFVKLKSLDSSQLDCLTASLPQQLDRLNSLTTSTAWQLNFLDSLIAWLLTSVMAIKLSSCQAESCQAIKLSSWELSSWERSGCQAVKLFRWSSCWGSEADKAVNTAPEYRDTVLILVTAPEFRDTILTSRLPLKSGTPWLHVDCPWN